MLKHRNANNWKKLKIKRKKLNYPEKENFEIPKFRKLNNFSEI